MFSPSSGRSVPVASTLCWQGQSSYAQSTLPSSLDLPVHEAPDAVQFYSSEELHSVLSLTTDKANTSLVLIYRIGKLITEQLCFSPFCINESSITGPVCNLKMGWKIFC